MREKECFKITKEGLKYIEQETKEFYADPKNEIFLKLVNKLIDKIFGEKREAEE